MPACSGPHWSHRSPARPPRNGLDAALRLGQSHEHSSEYRLLAVGDSYSGFEWWAADRIPEPNLRILGPIERWRVYGRASRPGQDE